MTTTFDNEQIQRSQKIISNSPYIVRHIPWAPHSFMRFQIGMMVSGKFALLGWGETYDLAVRRAHIAESVAK